MEAAFTIALKKHERRKTIRSVFTLFVLFVVIPAGLIYIGIQTGRIDLSQRQSNAELVEFVTQRGNDMAARFERHTKESDELLNRHIAGDLSEDEYIAQRDEMQRSFDRDIAAIRSRQP